MKNKKVMISVIGDIDGTVTETLRKLISDGVLPKGLHLINLDAVRNGCNASTASASSVQKRVTVPTYLSASEVNWPELPNKTAA